MSLSPGYGDTPLPHEELAALLPEVVTLLEKPILRVDVYDLEQGFQDRVTDDLMSAAIRGSITVDELLSDYFLRDLHQRLYGHVWDWAGRWRRVEVSIGIAPEQIAVELRTTLDNIRYRWEHADDWDARELGIAVHAETVRIHPFTDGNGRTTRLLADLVFAAAQDPTEWQYNWTVDKRRYIQLLREFDRHRDIRGLAAFVGVLSIES